MGTTINSAGNHSAVNKPATRQKPSDEYKDFQKDLHRTPRTPAEIEAEADREMGGGDTLVKSTPSGKAVDSTQSVKKDEPSMIDGIKESLDKTRKKIYLTNEEKEAYKAEAPHNNDKFPGETTLFYASGSFDEAKNSAEKFADQTKLSDWESKGVHFDKADISLQKVEGMDNVYAANVPNGAAEILNPDAFNRFRDEGWVKTVQKNL